MLLERRSFASVNRAAEKASEEEEEEEERSGPEVGGVAAVAAGGGGGGRDEEEQNWKYETFRVIKSRLARAALLSLSTLSIINGAAAFIRWRVNANTDPTHTSTACLLLFSTW